MKRRALPATERPNPRAARLDRLSTRKILELMNREDARVTAAVRGTVPQIARAVNAVVAALGRGGRLIYVGAGSSGRLGVLDAAECPPTFGIRSRQVQAVLAGGRRAMVRSAETAEDSAAAGARDLARKKVGRGDVVVALTASGSTPYALGALDYARRRGAFTVAVTANRRSPAARRARVAICPATGPEVIAGSTRLKAGTAQKLVLNMLSTAAMVRLGHVYRNLMVNVALSNQKLRQRGARVLEQALGSTPAAAARLIRRSGGNLKTAIVMARLKCNRRAAEAQLRRASGRVHRALGER
ncbi:MAG: N-acetylmuramic acid 6-phosphate etherase [Acidobacteria bacterium RIFCSPHIGHO2_02_FULL_67_57]|nr:MAG: N-acetylmuramic acid 6-phosphate etherase [Acidobacteria bacterium RIFCSPHIGHO2_02_FULL_67_57]